MSIKKLKIFGIFSIFISIIIGINFIVADRPIVYHFYSVDKLTEIFYESKSNKYRFNGAKCNDGWTSHSQGSGTCSWHGGVSYYFYKGEYIKTRQECEIKAKRFSWIE